jgi:FAD/FMN-containing dehydrogenase/Fe-S oxidoreductase
MSDEGVADFTMSAATQRHFPLHPHPSASAVAVRLRKEVQGEVLFDAFSRGRYSTDASIYQIIPIGVVVPRTEEDAVCAMQIAAEAGVPILPRGGGTSQCGQTVGEALIIDHSKYLNGVIEFDAQARTVCVQPGMVLDHLNSHLKAQHLFFPVDPSTADRATLGGMAGNNSCGTRSLRYGNMVHNVRAIDAVLASGESMRFGAVPANLDTFAAPARYLELVRTVRALHEREASEIDARYPKLLRRVAGYNIDTVLPSGHNMAQLLVGSEGTLAMFRRLHLDLQPTVAHRVLGICHFPRFRDAMKATRPIVDLQPAAVELIDRTMIELARDIAAFRPIVERCIKGEPDAILLVEFDGSERTELLAHVHHLSELMAELGFPGSVVEVTGEADRQSIWEVRKAGLNVMMSMKGDGKPVSFIEDCAVRLEDLADYTDRLTQVFEKYGTRGTWYAHASVGCLHVRPVLNLKTEEGARKMRAIAEEACALVREYKGAYSGEHGDGLVRSEWIEPMLGTRIMRAFEEIKDAFDPKGLLNPGKIVRAPRFDDRGLFRFQPGYRTVDFDTAFDWSQDGGLAAAVEMCNNNGACRKSDPGVMCPSFRVTGDEQHLTRGRANTLRLALSGQLGADAFTSDAMFETMDLCIGCKGCKRECPTGVDMAKMKVEFLAHYRQRHALPFGERLIAYLPRYAPLARRLGPVLNLRDRVRGAARLTERWLGLSAKRRLPQWRRDAFPAEANAGGGGAAGEVALFIDTFNRYFEPENAAAALRVLQAAGYRVHLPGPQRGRPLCCGRTFLASGLVSEAKVEARRLLQVLQPYAARGVAVVGLEPSCLLTLRDEFQALLPGEATKALAQEAYLFEEFLIHEAHAGRLKLPLKRIASKVLLHGHCHQKAFGAMPAVGQALRLVPDLDVETIASGCCGMAGAFGYQAKHYDLSMKMAELDLLPRLRSAPRDTIVVADGTSCRQQIRDGSGREAVHVARLLETALA